MRRNQCWLHRLVGGVLEAVTAPQAGCAAVHSLATRADGSLWVGTSEGLLQRTAGGFERVAVDGCGEHDVVEALLEDRWGTLWVGLDSGALLRLQGGQSERFSMLEGRPSAHILSLFEDREGSLWVGTDGGGLQLDEQRQSLRPVPGTGSAAVRAVLPVGDTVWLGTASGVRALTPQGTLVWDQARGLSHDSVRVGARLEEVGKMGGRRRSGARSRWAGGGADTCPRAGTAR